MKYLDVAVKTTLASAFATVLSMTFMPASFAQTAADTVFTNGKVYTMNAAQPRTEAIAVKGNKIVFVGSAAEAEAYKGPGTTTIDLAGRTVLPGFVSAHDHLIASSWSSQGVQLFGAKSTEETLQRIKEYAEAHPDHKVVKGIGWDLDMFGGKYPTAADLDKAVPNRPAFILDYTIHDGWLNTAALKAGNITKDTPDTLPGTTYWVRDDKGNPTGIAIEVQWMGAYIDAGAWDPENMIRESTESLFALAASNGTTTILNPGLVTPNVKDTHGGMEKDFRIAMDILSDLDKKGELKLRVLPLPIFKSAEADPARFIAFAKEMKDKYNSDRINVSYVKIHPEGNLTSGAAPTLEPYAGKDSKGGFNVAPEVTKELTLLANEAGMTVVIHTDGDASTRAAIDAFEAAKKAGYNNRNQLHHLIWTHPDDYKRIVDMKIPVNATPSFSNDFGGQNVTYTKLMGETRVNTELGKYVDLIRDGNIVSISADVPSTMPSMQAPLFVVEAAVTLMQPSEQGKSKPFPPNSKGMTVQQALEAVTINPAWQLGMEDKIGSLEVGKYADIVVLDQSPFEVDPLQIEEIKVAVTMMDGKFTYLRDVEDKPTATSIDIFLSPAEMTPAPVK